jgi:hypothetical protein
LAQTSFPHGTGIVETERSPPDRAARLIRNRLSGRRTPSFHYKDNATCDDRPARRRCRAWLSPSERHLIWLVAHLWYLIGFQNRLLVIIRWQISFFTRGRGARLITASVASGTPRRPGGPPSTTQTDDLDFGSDRFPPSCSPRFEAHP